MRCLAAKPIVNGIEKDLEGKAKVVRLNMLSQVGKEVAGQFGVQSIPTTLVLDATRKEIYRHSGVPNRREVVAQVTG